MNMPSKKNPKSTYDKNKSASFHLDNSKGTVPDVGNNEIFYAFENFTFYNNINKSQQIEIGNVNFLYYRKKNIEQQKNMTHHVCGRLGLSIRPSDYSSGRVNYIEGMINRHILNKYDYSVYHTNDIDGFLIIGEEPHNYLPEIYNEKDYRILHALPGPYTDEIINWRIEFSKIYYNFNGTENEIKTNKFASLSTNYYYRS